MGVGYWVFAPWPVAALISVFRQLTSFQENRLLYPSSFRILPRHSPALMDDGGTHFAILFSVFCLFAMRYALCLFPTSVLCHLSLRYALCPLLCHSAIRNPKSAIVLSPFSTETAGSAASAEANSHVKALCRFDQIRATACPVRKKIGLGS